MPHSALPPSLQIIDAAGKVVGSKPHSDWPWPLRLIPRGWTAFKWGPPRFRLGRINHGPDMKRVQVSPTEAMWAPKPITSPGTWQFSTFPGAPWWALPFRWYLAFSGRRAADGKFRHWRIGTRWDDVDDYVTILAIATRRFTGGDEQDTST